MFKYVPQKPGGTWIFFKKHEVHAVMYGKTTSINKKI